MHFGLRNVQHPIPLLEKLLYKTKAWYPALILSVVQIISSAMLILLTILPARANVDLTDSQAIKLLIVGLIALIFRNIVLLAQFYYSSRHMITKLAKIDQSTGEEDRELDLQAWKEANVAAWNFNKYEIINFFSLVLVPLILYSHFTLRLETVQIIQLSAAAVSSTVAVYILKNLALDQWFAPIIHVLLPNQYQAQLLDMPGMRLWKKLSINIIGLQIINLLMVVPTAHHQINQISIGDTVSSETIANAFMQIGFASIGAIFLGIILSIQIIFYFTTPFTNIINLFKKVEEGDLSQRVDVSLPNEFGRMDISLNHMLVRLQTLTSSLEMKVEERTAQLSDANEQLAYSVLHDSLTDLPNRTLFMDRLNHAMEYEKRHKDFTYAVFFIDLDRFKVVNDSLGHDVGDLLLVESAIRLKKCVRSMDTVARLGGDEFVILLEGAESPGNYLQIADRIQHDLSLPVNLKGYEIYISLSMGIVLDTSSYESAEEIIRNADIAMYRTKKEGRGHYRIFDQSMLDGVMTRLEMETELRGALERREFVLHYQPIWDIVQKNIIGFEALLRWQHPRKGLIQPADFISIIEDMGLIVPIGYWVIHEACRQIKIWQKEYNTDLSINVNLSTLQCAQHDLAQKIMEILDLHELSPSSLKLELTESVIVEDSEITSATLMDLRNAGIQVQIDDFGTGYSSLGYLHTLPIDTLKIDRTFINRLSINESGVEFVRTILALAHGLGMKVVAEGVETENQLSILESMNCEYVQGFLFAKPLDIQDAAALLAEKVL